MNDYKIKKQEWLENSRQAGQSLEEIYANSDERQLKLIAKCFDACIETVIEYNKINPKINSTSISSEISHHDVIIQFDSKSFCVDLNNIEAMQKNREKMCEIINNNTNLKLVDGGVKGKERSQDKVENQLLGDASQIDDINRVTILSDNYALVEKFLNNFNKKFNPKEICAKNDWDMKTFGLMSRSNDVLIDGYPTEVHINETYQVLLGQALTHGVYEVMRMQSSNPDFDTKFNNLPKRALNDLKENIKCFPKKHKILLCHLLKDLNKMVKKNKFQNTAKKKDELLMFNRKAHQFMISQANVSWINIYYNALKKFNENRVGKIKVEPILQKAYNQQKNISCFLGKMWYIMKDRRK